MKGLVTRGLFGVSVIVITLLFLGGMLMINPRPIHSLDSEVNSVGPSEGKEEAASLREINLALQQRVHELERDLEKASTPSQAYEDLRRQQELDLKELRYNLEGQKGKIGKADWGQIEDIVRLLRSYPKRMREEDGYAAWRRKELEELSDIVQKRLHLLQNPKDCRSARKILWTMKGHCGFGCQVHHLVYTLLMGYATGRTMVLESKGWSYNKEGWEEVFLPLSETCISPDGKSMAEWSWKKWEHGNQSAQVLNLTMSYGRSPKPPYAPITLPSDIAPRLEKVHGVPHAWWVGQLVKYLLRLQPKTKASLNEARDRMNFNKSSGPIVGVHVRHTDKYKEAHLLPLKNYMLYVEDYFAIREKFEGPLKRRMFIASDDPKVIEEAGRNFTKLGWQVLGDTSVAKSAALSTRYNETALAGLIKDVFLLAECSHLVCTFSSNICRLVYDLMQMNQVDPSEMAVSLDNMFYFALGSRMMQKARFGHKPMNEQDLELRVGDRILLERNANLWNGTCRGTNQRTNKTGLFPSYKGKDTYVRLDFPKKKWWMGKDD